jgi:hypothetical protein
MLKYEYCFHKMERKEGLVRHINDCILLKRREFNTMKKNYWIVALSLVSLLVTLSACGFPTKPVSTPTIDQQVIVNTVAAIQTQAVATSEYRLTQQALANPTIAPTATLLPSSTPYPTYTALPTYTFVPTATRIPMTSTPVVSPTPKPYDCQIISTSPTYGVVMAKGNDFDGKWVIKNTGTQSWGNTDVDIVYQSGTKFNKRDVYDMTASVPSGNEITILVDYLAPLSTGTFTNTFALRRGGATFCSMSVTIVTK